MIRVLLLFGLLGPPIGAIAYWWFVLQLAVASDGSHDVVFPTLGGVFMGVWDYPAAFAIGTIPAFATGLGYWLTLKYNTEKNPALLSRMLIGGMLGMTFATVYGLAIGETSIIYKFAVPGAIAAAVCAILIQDRLYSAIFPLQSGK